MQANIPGAEWRALTTDHPLTPAEIEARAHDLLAQMTLDEKIAQMSGDTPLFPGIVTLWPTYDTRPIPAGENTRLGIPGICFTDGPRGVYVGHATCFPVSMARGATWDPDLEERVGDVMGVEARSLGANFSGAVCINLLRHPRWGRAQETYGEDPFHLGEMGAALVRGLQRHVMACAKHYACNSIEDTRMKVDVRITERTLREVYLPHFKRCVDEGVAAVMSAYNKVNGVYCGHNKHLLRAILKNEWGFSGFVMSDFVFGVREAKAAALAGLDVEEPLRWHYARHLKRLVQHGEVATEVVDEAVLRILRQKIRFAQIGEPERYGPQAVASPEHRALARAVAQKSLVLLKNAPVAPDGRRLLPIDIAHVRRIAVIGRLASTPNIGDHGSSRVRPPSVVTPLQGIRGAAHGQLDILADDGMSMRPAVDAARRADLAIVVTGYTYKDEGEKLPWVGGDRKRLTLSDRDEELIQGVAAANPRTTVVLMGGGPIICEAWKDKVAAILMIWYPGMEGGHALADLLFGKVNPSGRLPCVFPASESQLPPFDNRADVVEYGYYHGYRLMDKHGESPAFPFGFGLSYTTFAYSNLHLAQKEIPADGALVASVDVTNTGNIAGDEVVQLYVGCEDSRVERPLKELKAFAKISLLPGETKTVGFALPAQRLAYYDEAQARWIVEAIGYQVLVGSSSAPHDLLAERFAVADRL